MFVRICGSTRHRIGCAITVWLSSAIAPALAIMPVEQPVDALTALEELHSQDLAWTSPRMQAFMRQWLEVTEPDESPCAPAEVKLSPMTTVCEYTLDNQAGDAGASRLLLGMVGTDKSTARIVSAVSPRRLSDDTWKCRPAPLDTFVCLPVGEDDSLFARWDNWLPRTQSEWFARQAMDPEMRYLQSVLASGQAMPADMPALLAWKQWQGVAMNTVRIERLVLIGQLCRVLDPADAATITRRAHTELDQHTSPLTDRNLRRAKDWLKALRIGATQSARVSDATDEASCQRFAAPYGTLSKLLTWTDKPQEASPGVRASPRTLP
ncbi:hypothetical protein IFR09_00850 [Pseudomonas syringae]|nr:hypothetical protein [Pseudomonas syringae]MBD8790644.1 hypothetical protein [Pseudomonas syringae]MBD8798881.1 hypothetical protein [Pseudomonas syringae]MBD8809708.1 hypothetical protein [Pseudomonas syringae]